MSKIEMEPIIIKLLDGSLHRYIYGVTTLGNEVIEYACNLIKVGNKEIYGLRYVDKNKNNVWIENEKLVHKITKHTSHPLKLRFGVKFYPIENLNHLTNVEYGCIVSQILLDVTEIGICSDKNVFLYIIAHVLKFHYSNLSHANLMRLGITELSIPDIGCIKKEYYKMGELSPNETAVRLIEYMHMMNIYGADVHYLNNLNSSQYVMINSNSVTWYKDSVIVDTVYWKSILKINRVSTKVLIESSFQTKKHCMVLKFTTKESAKNCYKCLASNAHFYTGLVIKPNSIRRSLTSFFTSSRNGPNRSFSIHSSTDPSISSNLTIRSTRPESEAISASISLPIRKVSIDEDSYSSYTTTTLDKQPHFANSSETEDNDLPPHYSSKNISLFQDNTFQNITSFQLGLLILIISCILFFILLALN